MPAKNYMHVGGEFYNLMVKHNEQLYFPKKTLAKKAVTAYNRLESSL